jgi:2-keto-4-pentenoate hydratase/2-oxohepta-3-ene-1,7-dioic acid hydratase in catechol pathway
MKIARCETAGGRVCYGRVSNGRIEPLAAELPFISGAAACDKAETIARFLPPVEPPNIFAIGRNYRAHAAEQGAEIPAAPLIFQKPTTTVIAHKDQIKLPRCAPEQVDFEAELAIVISTTARNVSEADALRYVAGFSCANDVTARDCQKADKQWTRGKGFDTFCPLGPYLVTPDEVDPDNLGIRSRLNGRVMQESSTSQMIFSCRKLVSYVSQQFTLLPGTLILTGTPEGIGAARQPPVFLRAGDRIEVEIDGIGILSNTVVSDS